MRCSEVAPDVNCCDSCHEDWGLGYDVPEIDHDDYPDIVPEGETWLVCCRVLFALDDASANGGDACLVRLTSSRVCERGTKSCVAMHNDGDPQ